LAAGLALLLAASLALAIIRRHHRAARPRGRRWAGRAGLAAWLTALTGLAALNAYVGYIPTLPALFGHLPATRGRTGSQVLRLSIGAPALDVPASPAYVYLPPGYDNPANATRRYLVVYLLHGWPGGPLDWFRAVPTQQLMDAMLADHLIQPMLVVAPNGNGGWLHDSEMLNQVGGAQLEIYLTHTVVGYVNAHFRTVADRAGRAIGELSSGGYGALNLGLRHQDVYSVILPEMPYGDPGRTGLALLGGSRALWAANAPDRYLPTMRFRHRMAVELLSGLHDGQRAEALRLERMLRAHRQPAVFTLVIGAGHTWRGAGLELPYALVFASRHVRTYTLGEFFDVWGVRLTRSCLGGYCAGGCGSTSTEPPTRATPPRSRSSPTRRSWSRSARPRSCPPRSRPATGSHPGCSRRPGEAVLPGQHGAATWPSASTRPWPRSPRWPRPREVARPCHRPVRCRSRRRPARGGCRGARCAGRSPRSGGTGSSAA
jgi:enterochelin esterase-like enzyme